MVKAVVYVCMRSIVVGASRDDDDDHFLDAVNLKKCSNGIDIEYFSLQSYLSSYLSGDGWGGGKTVFVRILYSTNRTVLFGTVQMLVLYKFTYCAEKVRTNISISI